MHRTSDQLEKTLGNILEAPGDGGRIEMIARRPSEDQRETLESGILDEDLGLIGDDWKARGEAYPQEKYRLTQVTLMNSRVAAAVAVTPERWPLAGDQIYVDMDLSAENLPPGTRLQVGEAIIEVSAIPHTGCKKFSGRFGADALRFVNIGPGREGRFRGMNAFVVRGGSFEVGDTVRKIAREA